MIKNNLLIKLFVGNIILGIFLLYIISHINLSKNMRNISTCEKKTKSVLNSLPKSNFIYNYTSSQNYKGPIIKEWPPTANRDIHAYIPKDGRNSFPVLPRDVDLASTELLIMVKTRTDAFQNRNLIRLFWGQLLMQLNPKSKVIFVIGKKTHNTTTNSPELMEEIYSHGDILQGDFVDNYYNLTLKVLTAYKFVLTSQWTNRPEIVITMDDDVYVNAPVLVKYAKMLNEECKGPYLIGHIPPNYVPNIDSPNAKFSSKWGVPSYMFVKGPDPITYLYGMMTIMSFETIECFYEEAYNLPIYHIDDIFTTGFCAKRCGIKPKNPKFHLFNHQIHETEIDPEKHLAYVLTLSKPLKEHMKVLNYLT